MKAHGKLLYKPPLDQANQKYHRRPDMRLKMSLWTANIPATLLFFLRQQLFATVNILPSYSANIFLRLLKTLDY